MSPQSGVIICEVCAKQDTGRGKIQSIREGRFTIQYGIEWIVPNHGLQDIHNEASPSMAPTYSTPSQKKKEILPN